MNVAVPANEIADTEAVYLQDILLDQPGLARRRGPMTAVTASALPRPGVGLAMTLDPQGGERFGVLTGTGSNGFFTVYNSLLSATADVTWPYNLGTSTYPIVNASAALNAGTHVATSTAYDSNSPSEALAYWGGGTNANYSAGTASITRGSTAVTGSGTAWLANASPGMWLFFGASPTLVGMVKSVNNDTSITLTAPSPLTSAASAYTLQSLRGVYPKVGKGTITGSGTTLTGGLTKFQKQGLGTGTWNIYRASDQAYVGTVSSVQSDTSLTLTATAAVAVADDAYVAMRQDGDWTLPLTTSKPGFLTSVYANRQWYANNGTDPETVYRLWFSDTSDPEILDMTKDGDWIPVNSTGDVQEPIVAIAGGYNALIVAKQTETFGVFGSDPTSFDVIKIVDDGAMSGMSLQNWGGGVIWAGRQGIWFYDGTTPENLTVNKFGNAWRELMTTFDPSTHRMWSMMERNHYILHIEGVSPPIAVVKGNVSTTPNHWVVVLNMDTQAVTLWQNVKMRGSVELPATQSRESWYLYNDGTKGVLAAGSAFFDQEGNDPLVEGVTGAGPDFYFVSKKIDGGNPTRLKRFTYFILNYTIAGDVLKLDTVLGQNDVGSTLGTTFPATVPSWNTISQSISTWTGLKNQFADWGAIVSAVFIPDRLRFLKKTQLMQFRLWQGSSNVTRLKVANYELGFKPMRPGRI